MFIRALITPFLYLSIPGKTAIDYWAPLFLGTAVAALFAFLPEFPRLLGEGGLVSQVSLLLSLLIGFFIAALSAVMTFNARGLDSPVQGEPIQVKSFQMGKWHRIELTRRRYLGFLFGYLTAAGILIFLVGLLGNAVAPSLKKSLSGEALFWFKVAFVWVYAVANANLVTTTMYGLYYLIERVHRH